MNRKLKNDKKKKHFFPTLLHFTSIGRQPNNNDFNATSSKVDSSSFMK